jgi:hypothetical protein
MIETPGGYLTVYASLKCLVEPLKAWRKATLLGTVAGKKFIMSWEGGEELREGDRVTWNTKNYRLEYGEDDRYRPTDAIVTPYQTAYLHEELI